MFTKWTNLVLLVVLQVPTPVLADAHDIFCAEDETKGQAEGHAAEEEHSY